VEYFLPSEWEALRAWFDDRGWQVAVGQSGRYAEAVVSLIGGVENLNVLATKQAYNLVYRLALKSSKKVAQRLNESLALNGLGEEEILRALTQLDIGPELKGIPKTLTQLMSDPSLVPRETVAETVERLVKVGALRRGVYLQCPRCGSSEWHAINQLEEHPR
jgi:hypothetical protein